jgi:hypothetical protein
MAAPLVTSKDMMHPAPPATGQFMGATVILLAVTLVKIQSFAGAVEL